MSNWLSHLDPEKLKTGPRPGGPVVTTVLVLSTLPFLAFGGFMIWQVLRIANRKNYAFAIPFMLFALAIAAVPLVQVFSILRKSRQSALLNPPLPSAAKQAPEPAPTKSWSSLGLALFGLPFAGFGVAALVGAVTKFRQESPRDALMSGMFGAVFCSVGFGLMIYALRSRRGVAQVQARQALHPDAPWLWREDWASGQIRSLQSKAALTAWVFAIFWNAISWMVTIGLLTDSRQSHSRGVVLLVLLFPAIGLALLAAAVRATLVARRFGASVLRLKSLPVVLGGALDGVIELSTTLPKDATVRTRLCCLHRVTTGSGDDRRTQENVLWQRENLLRPGLPEFRAGRTGIPVFFAVPADQPPVTPSGGDGVLWRVEAEAKISGPDLKLQFEVPVFLGRPSDVPAEDPTAKYQLPVEAQRQALHSRIRVSNAPTGGKEFYFPAARSPGAASAFSVFALLCLGVAVFIGRETLASLRGEISFVSIVFALFSGVFPVVFGGVGLLLSLVCADLWLRRTRLVVDGYSLTRTQQWLFLKRRQEFRSTEIQSLFLKVGMTSGTKVYQDLKAQLASGREITLASAIPNQAEADWLLAELKRALKRGG